MKERPTKVCPLGGGVILVPSSQRIVGCKDERNSARVRWSQYYNSNILNKYLFVLGNRSRDRILTEIENMVFVAPVLHIGMVCAHQV